MNEYEMQRRIKELEEEIEGWVEYVEECESIIFQLNENSKQMGSLAFFNVTLCSDIAGKEVYCN